MNVFILIFLLILSLVVKAFVFSKMWLWFVVPTFHGIPPISTAKVLIFYLMLFLFMRGEGSKNENEDMLEKLKDKEVFKEQIFETVAGIVFSLIMLLLAYCYYKL